MLYNVFIWFIDQENICLDPKIMILHEVISKILEISDLSGHFEKWLKLVVITSFFFIANMISDGPLNNMVPLMEDHWGGGGDPR